MLVSTTKGHFFMKRTAIAAVYALLWAAWLLWGMKFLQMADVFGGSYWIGFPDREASLLTWLMWPFLFVLLYLLPIGLIAAPVLLARQRRG
jgi:hypothetical protein